MKLPKSLFFVLLACMAFMLTSCDDTAKGIEKDATEAQQAIEDQFNEERAEMQESLNATKAEINEQITTLEAELEDASDDAKESINNQIEQLQNWSADVDRELDRVANATAENWEDLKQEVSTWDEEFKSGWNSMLESMKVE